MPGFTGEVMARAGTAGTLTAVTVMNPPRASARPVGQLLREWRQRRRLSQLDLAIEAEISARHLSFVETGRSRPTSDMIMRLSEHLDVPLRDRNALLLAGGYAPAYPEHGLDEPELAAVRAALRQVLDGPSFLPAVVLNRWWELVDASAGVGLLTAGAAPELLEPPVNVLRLSLHPDGMAPRIINLAQWRAHLLTRLSRQAASTGDARLAELHEELLGYPGGQDGSPAAADVVAPLRYRLGRQDLSFFSMTAVIGTPMDVTVAELAIESFYPADEATAAVLGEAATAWRRDGEEPGRARQGA
jgi:transcriptional regulator with XRE-family HTH domain